MRSLGGGSEFLQIGFSAKPRWPAVKNSSIFLWHPSLSEHPACLLANTAEHDFQRGREIAGCRHLHRDCLQQAKLLFARWIDGFSMFASLPVDIIWLVHSEWLHRQCATHCG